MPPAFSQAEQLKCKIAYESQLQSQANTQHMPTTSWHVRGAVPKLDNTPHCLKFVGITSRPLPLPLSVTPAHQPLLFNTAPTTSIVAFPSPFSIGLPHLFGKSPSAHTGWYHSSVLHWPVCLHLGAASSSSANLQHARRNQLSVPMLFVLLTPPSPTPGMIQQQYQPPTPQSRQNGLGPCGRAEQTLYLGDPMASRCCFQPHQYGAILQCQQLNFIQPL